jgi:N-acetylglucosamine malate deacetylase 1
MEEVKLDILAFGAHPDDVELGAGGTVAKHVHLGFKVGIVDLTQGQLGSRGTVNDRIIEAAESSMLLGLTIREILKWKMVFFKTMKNTGLK